MGCRSLLKGTSPFLSVSSERSCHFAQRLLYMLKQNIFVSKDIKESMSKHFPVFFFLIFNTAILKEKSKKQKTMCTTSMFISSNFSNTNDLIFVLSLSGNQRPLKFEIGL